MSGPAPAALPPPPRDRGRRFFVDGPLDGDERAASTGAYVLPEIHALEMTGGYWWVGEEPDLPHNGVSGAARHVYRHIATSLSGTYIYAYQRSESDGS